MKSFCRAFFISPEFLVILLAIAIYILWGERLDQYLKKVKLNQDTLKYIFSIPCVMYVWILKKNNSILQRDNANTKILVEWEGYKDLKNVLYIGIIYATISVVLCLGIALIYINSALHIITFISGFLIISIVAISFYFAEGTIKDIFTKYT